MSKKSKKGKVFSLGDSDYICIDDACETYEFYRKKNLIKKTIKPKCDENFKPDPQFARKLGSIYGELRKKKGKEQTVFTEELE